MTPVPMRDDQWAALLSGDLIAARPLFTMATAVTAKSTHFLKHAMRQVLHFESRSSIQLLRLLLGCWPYLLIAICVVGLAYRYWQFLHP